MACDGMHLQVLKELADVTAKPLSIIFERSGRTADLPEESHCHFRKGKEDDVWNSSLVSLTSIPGNMMEELILHCHL